MHFLRLSHDVRGGVEILWQLVILSVHLPTSQPAPSLQVSGQLQISLVWVWFKVNRRPKAGDGPFGFAVPQNHPQKDTPIWSKLGLAPILKQQRDVPFIATCAMSKTPYANSGMVRKFLDLLRALTNC